MATLDQTKGAAGAKYPAQALPTSFLLENTMDTLATNAAAADIIQMIKVTAPVFVLFAGLEVLVLEGGTMTLDMGDGDNADGYLDGVNGDGTVLDVFMSSKAYIMTSTSGDFDNEGAVTALNIYSVVGGKLYTSDDTIDVITVNAANLLKFRAFAKVEELKP